MKNGFHIAISIVLSMLLSSCFNASEDLEFFIDGECGAGVITGVKEGVSIKVLNIPSMVEREDVVYGMTHPVTAIGYNAFSGNEELEEIVFPEWIDILEGAFKGCTNLRKVVFTGSNGRIERGAFANCPNLQDVVGIKNNEAISYGAFKGCTNLKNKKDVLPRECTVNFRLEDFKVAWGSRVTPSSFYCNMSSDGYYTKSVNGILTKEIVVPEGERWVYKDHFNEFSCDRKKRGGLYYYYDPYIRRNFKGNVKEYKLPEDGRNFTLYAGDVFQVGINFVFDNFEFADISVVFSVYYED